MNLVNLDNFTTSKGGFGDLIGFSTAEFRLMW